MNVPRLALAALAASTLLTPTPQAAEAAVRWGPPILCHPIDIGTAASLPWGEHAFDLEASFDRDDTVGRTHAILVGSDDPFVHMETLRRAVLYLTRGVFAPGDAGVQDLVGTLEKIQDGALLVVSRAGPGDVEAARAAWGLAAFDLAWTLEALAETGHRPRSSKDAERWLRSAVVARPHDPALRLGASIITFARGEQGLCYVHLDRALAAVGEDESSDLLRRNISNTMGGFLGARSHADLVAKVAAELERA